MLHEGPNLHVRVFSIDIWFCQLISILDEDSSYGEYVAAKHLSKRIFQVTLFSYFFLKKEKNGHKQLLKINYSWFAAVIVFEISITWKQIHMHKAHRETFF